METSNNLTIVKSTNCYDETVWAYEINNNKYVGTIYAPRASECGRFAVDPLETYGITDAQADALHALNQSFGYDDVV